MVKLGGGNSQYASAADASTKSLIAVFDNDEKTLYIGAVPKSHGGICAIDEVGRMSPEDQGYLLSAMEDGEIPYARFARDTKLAASDTFILAANPVGNYGSVLLLNLYRP